MMMMMVMMMHGHFVPFHRHTHTQKNGPGWECVTSFHEWFVCLLNSFVSDCLLLGRICRRRRKRAESLSIELWHLFLTSPHCRCPLAASISPRVQRMREQLATTQAERRILGPSTRQRGFDPNRRRSSVWRRRARWFARRPLRFYSACASVASRRQIVTLTTCDYPQTERSGVASSRSS